MFCYSYYIARHKIINYLFNSAALCRQFLSLNSSLRPSLTSAHSLNCRIMSSSHSPQMNYQPLKVGDCFQGQKGRTYTVQELLSERKECGLYVYKTRCALKDIQKYKLYTNSPLKSANGKFFVAKNMMPGEYEYQRDLQTSLSSCPNLRVFEDGSQELDLFVYSYLETNVLQECRSLNKDTKKNLLKSALTGLAAMHERNIIHTGKDTPSISFFSLLLVFCHSI